MRIRSHLFTWLAVLIFLIGEGIGLSLSGAVLWGEIEVLTRSSFTASENMPLDCPLMVSSVETGTIQAEISNYTNREIKPVVTSEISRTGGASRSTQTYILAPTESANAEWTVNSSNAIFGNLILVSVFQSQYRDNPSRLGVCGILLLDLFGLTGEQAFYVIFVAAIACLVAGAGLWYFHNRPVDDQNINIVRAGILLAVMNTVSLLCTIPRWWGFILMLDAFSLLAMSVILVDFILFSQKRN